ncbi:MAG: RNA polymerase sigma factor [Mangrovibacterium sp.]
MSKETGDKLLFFGEDRYDRRADTPVIFIFMRFEDRFYILYICTQLFNVMAGKNIEHSDRKLTRDGLQALMSLYSEGLFVFVRGIVRNNETAEELVSDVFVKIWSKRDQFANIRNIKSYLFILARNESISFIRRNKRVKIINIEEVDDYYFTPLESDGSELFDQEMIDRSNRIIESLPTKCKMAFSLAKVNGLKYREIAEIMGISPLTVKNHIAYALEKICSGLGLSRKGSSVTPPDVYLFLFSKK